MATIKTGILIPLLLGFISTSCINERQQHSKMVPEETIGIIGGSDTVTSIIISDHASRHDKDTIIYELPQCQLWYTKPLSENYKGKEIQMWTEHKVYWENVQVINVFVANPTDIPLGFGRPILVDQWKDNKWCLPERKDTTCDLAWQDDAFMIEKAPLLYCFRCELDEFLMPKGKYKVSKLFFSGTKKIEVNTNFEIK